MKNFTEFSKFDFVEKNLLNFNSSQELMLPLGIKLSFITSLLEINLKLERIIRNIYLFFYIFTKNDSLNLDY